MDFIHYGRDRGGSLGRQSSQAQRITPNADLFAAAQFDRQLEFSGVDGADLDLQPVLGRGQAQSSSP